MLSQETALINPSPKPLLEMRQISKSFLARQGFFNPPVKLHAVDNVSLKLPPAQSLGLVGESGCGKSTLGRIACGLLMPDEGEVLLQERLLPAAGAGSWAAGQIQMIFQDPASSLNPRLKVMASVAEPLLAKGARKKEAAAQAEEILKAVGLEGMGQRYPHQFSGGQKQRVAVGRAIITHPLVIVCDEPVSALDVSVQAQILNLLKDVQEQYKLSYLFISHDLAVVGFMCERILVMYLGQLVEMADRDDIFKHPAHPYTAALLASMPGGEKAWSHGKSLHDLPPALPGELPSPINPPSGCKFHPRCVKAQTICSKEQPQWKNLAENWRVRCHFPND